MELRKIVSLLVVIFVLMLWPASIALGQAPDATSDPAEAFIEAVEAQADVVAQAEPVTPSPIVIEVQESGDDWNDTLSILVFGVFFLGTTVILYLLNRNTNMAKELRDAVPPHVWDSAITTFSQGAGSYAARTKTDLDDKLLELIVQQVKAILIPGDAAKAKKE